MDFIEKEISKYASKLTDTAKDSAVETLNDPKFRQAINDFTHQWVDEHKVVLLAIFGTMFLLTCMATVNVVTDFRGK